MKTSTRIITAAAAALALGAGGLVFAQAGQGPYGRMGGMGMQQAGMGMHGGGYGGMRGGMRSGGAMGDPTAQLAAAKAELKITAAQEEAWQAFEKVALEQAQTRQAMRTAMQAQMQARQQDPNAAANVDHAAQRESMLKARESHQATMDVARQALFTVLTPEQKALAEQRMLGSQGAGRGARMHRHAG
ncbi:MAG: Spy/CpxP family protein refolding chaperone [Rubrivivax sp.]|nr:Spy/CpxP family protein refolding chaperone [Rubrivivax sp.]